MILPPFGVIRCLHWTPHLQKTKCWNCAFKPINAGRRMYRHHRLYIKMDVVRKVKPNAKVPEPCITSDEQQKATSPVPKRSLWSLSACSSQSDTLCSSKYTSSFKKKPKMVLFKMPNSRLQNGSSLIVLHFAITFGNTSAGEIIPYCFVKGHYTSVVLFIINSCGSNRSF